jgi:ABC-type molybdate transport system ATPase subunit
MLTGIINTSLRLAVNSNVVSIFKRKNVSISKIDDFKTSIVELLSNDIEAKIMSSTGKSKLTCLLSEWSVQLEGLGKRRITMASHKKKAVFFAELEQ